MTPPVTEPSLRPMRWQDLAAVADLEARLFRDDPWTVQTWWAELAERPRRDYLVLTDPEDQPVGYAGLDVAGETADVMTVAVSSQLQGSGAGTTLLGALLDRAASAGAETVLLEVRADNAAARALYAQHGFEVVQRRHRYYPDGQDALVMRRGIRR